MKNIFVFKSSVIIELSYQAIKYFLTVQVSPTVGCEIGHIIAHITVILQSDHSRQGYPKFSSLYAKQVVIFPALQVFKISTQFQIHAQNI